MSFSYEKRFVTEPLAKLEKREIFLKKVVDANSDLIKRDEIGLIFWTFTNSQRGYANFNDQQFPRGCLCPQV